MCCLQEQRSEMERGILKHRIENEKEIDLGDNNGNLSGFHLLQEVDL